MKQRDSHFEKSFPTKEPAIPTIAEMLANVGEMLLSLNPDIALLPKDYDRLPDDEKPKWRLVMDAVYVPIGTQSINYTSGILYL